jgi:hypothetical protein
VYPVPGILGSSGLSRVPDIDGFLASFQILFQICYAFAKPSFVGVVQEICDVWLRHCVLIERLDLYVPKHHLMVHCNHRIGLQGNPWRFTTFLDESMNKELKRVLRLCHQATFETTAMVKLAKHLDSVSKRMRRHL